MKNKKLLFVFLIGACVFQACQNVNKNSNDPDSINRANVDSSQKAQADTMGQDPAAFMKKIAAVGMMEIELGKVAQQNGSDARVKQFGALMVKDHSKANDKLIDIAKAKNVALPTSFSTEDQAHIDGMKKMSGKDFDKHYIDMMVDGHAKTIDLVKMATSSSDTTVSNFANMVLPVIEGHHTKAVEISKALK